MNSFKLQSILFSFLSVLALVGCQQPGEIGLKSLNATKVSQLEISTSETPQDDLVSVVRPAPGSGLYVPGQGTVTTLPAMDLTLSTGNCASFMDQLKTIEDSSKNLNLSGNNVSVIVDAVRNIMITGNSGDVFVNSSNYASNVNGNSGRVFLNAGRVMQIAGNSSQEICVKASQIGSVSGNSAHISIVADSIETVSGGSGDNRITAKSIGTIQGNSSLLHIYKAQVSKIRGQSGPICLYDGARIIDVDSSNSGQIRSDCL